MINTGDLAKLNYSFIDSILRKDDITAFIWDEQNEEYISHATSSTIIILVLGQEPTRVTRTGHKVDTTEWASILIDNLVATVRFDWLKTL